MATMSPARSVGVVVLVVAMVCLLVLGAVRFGESRGVPRAEGVDTGFARDMQTHHQQAVELSFIVRDKTSDPALRTLTYDIINTQAHQAGQMYGWLDTWRFPQTSSEPPMAWMEPYGHTGHGSDPMAAMGMATSEQIKQLQAAEGVEAERLFLQLMITHHEGALGMAQVAADHASTNQVRGLATKIIEVQTSETRLMKEYLQARQ